MGADSLLFLQPAAQKNEQRKKGKRMRRKEREKSNQSEAADG
jgi:hypothetical protein